MILAQARGWTIPEAPEESGLTEEGHVRQCKAPMGVRTDLFVHQRAPTTADRNPPIPEDEDAPTHEIKSSVGHDPFQLDGETLRIRDIVPVHPRKELCVSPLDYFV